MFEPLAQLPGTSESQDTTLLLAVITVGSMFLFALPILLATHNICKHWNQRSFSLGLFYLVALMALFSREVFFVSVLFEQTNLTFVVLLIMPGTFSLDIAIA